MPTPYRSLSLARKTGLVGSILQPAQGSSAYLGEMQASQMSGASNVPSFKFILFDTSSLSHITSWTGLNPVIVRVDRSQTKFGQCRTEESTTGHLHFRK
eukprot:SAG22_NODE_695_length_7843_cov_2.924587_7_plen_99_part_00